MIPDDADDMYDMIEKVSKKIKTEISNIEINRKIITTMLTETFAYIFKATLQMICCQK